MKKMTDISAEIALSEYKIKCAHSISEDGELRFRLVKDDGTAYIRTEAPPNGQWQDSHWHNKVRETYIVQKGWIGYAEQRGGSEVYEIYEEGELFTTPPDIIHTVYMPKEAVIHTVKHGDAAGEQRLEDERTDRFNKIVQSVSETKLKEIASRLAHRESSLAGKETGYCNQCYKHFDNLIWQVPAWSTAIFALLLVGLSRLAPTSSLVVALGVTVETLIGGLALLFGCLLLVLSFALYRFRWHQAGVKGYEPMRPLMSPQVGLQFLVNLQSALLLLASAKILGLAVEVFMSAVVLVVGVIMYSQERALIRHNRDKGFPRSTKS